MARHRYIRKLTDLSSIAAASVSACNNVVSSRSIASSLRSASLPVRFNSLARLTASCQRLSLFRFSASTCERGSLPMCASQLNVAHTMMIIATITAGITNSCTIKPALGGSTGGKASLGESGAGRCGKSAIETQRKGTKQYAEANIRPCISLTGRRFAIAAKPLSLVELSDVGESVRRLILALFAASAMFLLEHAFSTAADNLALDEALLDHVEQLGGARSEAGDQGAAPPEFLRLWESPRPAVVIGRSSSLEAEVDTAECRRRGVEVLRRTSGGAAVVLGPGCLMYSVVLSYHNHPELRAVDLAHRHVLGRVAAAVRALVPNVALRGTSDLALGEQKFSGNSLRCRREAMLYHGTLLYNFPLDLIAAVLRTAPRQPEYRAGREHRAFVANLPTTAAALRANLIESFAAHEAADAQVVAQLSAVAKREAQEKFAAAEWTARVP
ncbi:MAG: hypothetical protein C0483_15230 [Pirellula sp.]|nr:hypothetical protein [Pirellula sp.]